MRIFVLVCCCVHFPTETRQKQKAGLAVYKLSYSFCLFVCLFLVCLIPLVALHTVNPLISASFSLLS